MINLDNTKKVYCIGIGGIGLSAVVRLLVARGIQVSGSDRSVSEVTKLLEDTGVEVFYDQSIAHVSEGTDLVLYSKAIPESNPDLIYAKEQGIIAMTYPEILGVISDHKKTIQITGTHGKTTTTAMTAKAIETLDPSIIVGSLIKHNGQTTNYVEGASDYFVLESCEYKRSFEHVRPFVLVITNIEEDHLDYYKNLADIQSAFRDVAKKVPENGAIVCDPKDPNLAPVIEGLHANIIDYTQVNMDDIELQVPGNHNVRNAECARAVADFLGIKKEDSKKGLEAFSGTWRRFEYKGELSNGAIVYDDYGHHPSEIRATLEGFREKFQTKKILLAFHPHEFSRTKFLFNDFVTELSKADLVVLAPIFAAREIDDGTVSSQMLADEIVKNGTEATAKADFAGVEEYIRNNSDKDTVVVTMGAGDIYKVAQSLVNK